MGAVFTALAKAFGQLTDPAVLRVLLKSLLVTVAIFFVLGGGLWWLLDTWLENTVSAFAGDTYGNAIVAALTVVSVIVAGWLLFRVVAIAVLQFFADEIVGAVERRHYPDAAANARNLPLSEDFGNSMRGIWRALLMNALALPVAAILLFTAIGPAIVFLFVNAVLLGRELTDMAWLRHRQQVNATTPVSAIQRFALGGITAGLMLVPIVNLLAPILGAAAGTHLTHRAIGRSETLEKVRV